MNLNEWKKLVKTSTQAMGMSPSQIRKISGQTQKLVRQESSSFELEADKLEAIRQHNSKGFQVLDINPNNIQREDAFCAYQAPVLNALIGTESATSVNMPGAGNLYYDNEAATVTNSGVPVPYWRSIYIPVVGNFLKVEYLPARVGVNSLDLQWTPGAGQNIQNSSTPQNTSEPTVLDFYAPFVTSYFNANKLASDRIILLDFNQTTDKPIIVKHGDGFKNYFNGVWLTFKQDSPRIRVTIGFNSEIQSQDDRPKNLHMWRGDGLLNNSTINPIPFNISNSDVSGGEFGLQTTGSTLEYCLMANPTPTLPWEQKGMSIFWLTDTFFDSYMTHMTPAIGTSMVIKFSLYIKHLGTAPSYTAGASNIKRVLERVITKQGIGTISPTSSLGEPLRVCLREDTGLFLKITPLYGIDTPSWINFFSLSGYCMGPIQNTLLSATASPLVPFTTRYKFGENPYPIDFDDLYSPLR